MCAVIVCVYVNLGISSSMTDKLKKDITPKHMKIIARDHLTSWEDIYVFLGLNPTDAKEIKRNSPDDYGEQKHNCLLKWKKKKGEGKATYEALISAAEEADDKLLADHVRSLGMAA